MTNQNTVLDQFHVQYESTELIFEFSFIVFTLILFVPYLDKKLKSLADRNVEICQHFLRNLYILKICWED